MYKDRSSFKSKYDKIMNDTILRRCCFSRRKNDTFFIIAERNFYENK